MARAIDHHRLGDGLAALRWTATARSDRHAFAATTGNGTFGLLHRARRYHPERHDLVVRGVGGIAPTGEGVEVHFAHPLRLEPPFQHRHQQCRHVFLHAHFRSSSAKADNPVFADTYAPFFSLRLPDTRLSQGVTQRDLTRMSHSLFNPTS